MSPSTVTDRPATRHALMAHMVSFFPDEESSLAIARGLAEGGARYLEVQFPFSDPQADGTVIQAACSTALAAGFTVDGGMRLLARIVTETGLPVFVMSYASLVFRRGTDRFVRECREAGAAGLIVPDLPPGNDEGLYEAGRRHQIEVVPVVAPSISEGRLARVANEHPHYLYAALRVGITGSYTDVGRENLAFLSRLQPLRAQIVAGFGISSAEQVETLAPHVHALVVGSAFVRTVLEAVEQGTTSSLGATLAAQVQRLIGGSARP